MSKLSKKECNEAFILDIDSSCEDCADEYNENCPKCKDGYKAIESFADFMTRETDTCIVATTNY